MNDKKYDIFSKSDLSKKYEWHSKNRKKLISSVSKFGKNSEDFYDEEVEDYLKHIVPNEWNYTIENENMIIRFAEIINSCDLIKRKKYTYADIWDMTNGSNISVELYLVYPTGEYYRVSDNNFSDWFIEALTPQNS